MAQVLKYLDLVACVQILQAPLGALRAVLGWRHHDQAPHAQALLLQGAGQRAHDAIRPIAVFVHYRGDRQVRHIHELFSVVLYTSCSATIIFIMPASPSSFSCAAYIREIGRGARGARGLSRQDASILYQAMLAGRVGDLELGAILLSYRIKGESALELAGMLDAVHDTMTPLDCALATPVVIPSYNGARKRPNLVALLASLLARRGIPVLIHGVQQDPGRVTTAEILNEMGVQASTDAAGVTQALAQRRLAFAPIEILAPALARQLSLREPLGVRNSAHTLAKILQPFSQPALRLVSYTHPAYRDTLIEYFSLPQAAGPMGVLLSRGTEGEAAADTALQREALWLHDGGQETAIAAADKHDRDAPALPQSLDAVSTARWIADVLQDWVPVPHAIAVQADAIAAIVAPV